MQPQFFSVKLFSTISFTLRRHYSLPSLLIGLFVVIGLEGHHAIFREITLTSHRNPFALPVVLSGILIGILTLVLVRWIGLWGLILAPGLVQICFNNWWTVLVGLHSMGKTHQATIRRDFLGAGTRRTVEQFLDS